MDKELGISFDYMWKDQAVARVEFDMISGEGRVAIMGDGPFDDPFRKPVVSHKELWDFFEWRCFPRARYDAKRILRDLEVDFYEPYQIVLKTRGQQYDDFYWIRFDGDTVGYEEIKLRD